MRRNTGIISGVAFFLAGMTTGLFIRSSKSRSGAQANAGEYGAAASSAVCEEPVDATAGMQDKATAERLNRIETLLEEHAAKLAKVPTSSHIATVMEQLLAKNMTLLDERLITQAQSIEVLRTTVSQTDKLLERVLESLDSLETLSDSSEAGEAALLSSVI